jgi:hypothetical protein
MTVDCIGLASLHTACISVDMARCIQWPFDVQIYKILVLLSLPPTGGVSQRTKYNTAREH